MNCDCGNIGLYFCNNCDVKSYCCKDCQIKDWDIHKYICNDMLMDNIEYTLAKTFNNLIFNIHRDFELNIIEVVFNNNKLIILPGKKWSSVKNMIHNILEDKPKLCNACCEILDYKIACEKCKNIYCSSCYIESYKKNNGIIECPYCAHKIGKYVPSNKLLCGIGDIIDKLKYI